MPKWAAVTTENSGGPQNPDDIGVDLFSNPGYARPVNGYVSKAYRAADQYTRHRLRQWLRAKHKLYRGAERSRFSDQYLEQRLGLVRLQRRTRNLPWANA